MSDPEFFRFTAAERRIFRKRIRPRPSEWAARNIVVQDGPYAGSRLRMDVTPYMPGIMDTFFQRHIEEVAVCASPQISKSEMLFACLFYSMEFYPGPKLMAMPDEDTLVRAVEKKLLPRINGSAALRKLFLRYAKGNLELADGSTCYLASAQSPSQRASVSVMHMFLDEVDLYRQLAGQGAPVTEFEERVISYEGKRKILKISKPLGDESSVIWITVTTVCDELRRWHVPCPACGTVQVMDEVYVVVVEDCRDPTAMMGAYYQVLSSGATDSAKAMDLLTTSAKASKAAHVSQSETVKGLTKLMAGYDGEIRSAAEASDLLFRIDNLGQTSFAELVPVIGDVAEVTHLVGVTSQEMAAGLALVTQTSGSTSEAATKWKAIMVGLYKPTENMEKVLKALGYESGQAMVQQLGFAGTLQKLQAVAEASGFSMGKLFESSEALTGIAGLGAQEWERYTGILDGVRKGSDETDQAWQRWLVTSQAVKDNYDATLKPMAIEFGGELSRIALAGATPDIENGLTNCPSKETLGETRQ